jgi:hypothetical protein
MSSYLSSKIYKIFIKDSPDSGVYIGSTTLPLVLRFGVHRTQFQSSPTGAGCCRSWKLFQEAREKEQEVVIELLEEYPCESIHELRLREAYHIRNTPGVINKKIPGRTPVEYAKEYYQSNRRKIKALNLAYYYNHKEECLQRNREYKRRMMTSSRREENPVQGESDEKPINHSAKMDK